MFGSTILNVAIGLIFTFLVISLVTGSIIEAGASLFQWRSKMLLSGVRQLVNNPALVVELYKHALVNPRGSGAPGSSQKNNPAYIEPNQFASALMDIVGISGEIANQAAAGVTGAATVVGLKNVASNKLAVPVPRSFIVDAQMTQLLDGVIERTLGDPAKLKTELAAWFDNGMDRLSGLYKRWTQFLSLVVALLLAMGCNVDSIRIGEELWAQPAMATKIATSIKLENLDKDVPGALSQMNHTIPVGWPDGKIFTMQTSYPMAILGWIITAVATLFGAPFWFDALQSITRLKGAGPSPDEKASGRSASA